MRCSEAEQGKDVPDLSSIVEGEYISTSHTHYPSTNDGSDPSVTKPEPASEFGSPAADGMTSYKAYMEITREELGVAIQQAHALKLKLTGICAP